MWRKLGTLLVRELRLLGDELVAGRGLPQCGDREAGRLERAEVVLERPVLNPEVKDPVLARLAGFGHRSDVEHVAHRLGVLAHVEGPVLVARDEEPARQDRVQDPEAERSTGRQHARELGDRAVEILDVHEHHEAHDEVGGAGR